ncbi:Cytochrome c oxidase subunit 7C, mitochondrial, partial [Clarias magur]
MPEDGHKFPGSYLTLKWSLVTKRSGSGGSAFTVPFVSLKTSRLIAEISLVQIV